MIVEVDNPSAKGEVWENEVEMKGVGMVVIEVTKTIETSFKFKYAMRNDHSKGWKNACDAEITMVKKLNVCKLMHTPINEKLIDTNIINPKENQTGDIVKFNYGCVVQWLHAR